MPACSPFLFCSWECGGGPRGPRTARQAGAPGGEAVAFRSSAGAGRGRGWRPGAGQRRGGGPGRSPWPSWRPQALRPPASPSRSAPGPGLSCCPRAWGLGGAGSGSSAAFVALGLVSVPFKDLGTAVPAPASRGSCVRPRLPRWGAPGGQASSPGEQQCPAPRGAGPAAPKAIPLPSPQRRIPRDRFLPGPQPANTRIFNLGLSAIMVLFDASLATWPLMRDCAFPRQLRALLVKSRGRAIICRWSPKAGVGSDAANYTPAPRPRAHTSSRGNRPGRGRCDMRCSE